MCGIVGIFNFDGKKVERKVLQQMHQVLSHRGPDGQGELVEKNVGLANRRLAIIDPTPVGRQPMATEDKNLWITFNGEIFNYRELRKDLIGKGYQFKSQTDTEVLLYGYCHYGEDFVERLIGQFAFCLWDKKRERFFLARDQIGVNPLYYAQVGKTFLFASEVKAILASGLIKKEIDFQALHHYLSCFHIPAPLTIFKEIESLLPGHFMIVDKKGIKIKKYYHLSIGLWQEEKLNEEEIKEKLREVLILCVNYAKVADVPVAAFLSGGVDSSTVVALLAKQSFRRIKTFSLWSEGGEVYDERRFARVIVQKYNTEHTEFTITEKDFLNELPRIVYYFDQPTGGSLEGYFISKYAAKEVKVALSGLGGDELFAGYHSEIYKSLFLSRFYRLIPEKLKKILLFFVHYLSPSSDFKKTLKIADEFLEIKSAFKKLLYLYFVFSEEEKKRIYRKEILSQFKNWNTEFYFQKFYDEVKNLPIIDRFSYLDLNTYTRDDLLLGLNMMSMAHSLEARVPLLDPRLVEFSAKIPPKFKYKNGISKYILKEVVKEWLPEEIIRHKKTGFAMPRVKYMKGVLKPFIKRILSKESLKKRGIFESDYVEVVLDNFFHGSSEKMLWREHLRVWILFIFELWCRFYLDKKEIAIPNISLSEMC